MTEDQAREYIRHKIIERYGRRGGQSRLAEKLGVRPSYISNQIGPNTSKRICKALREEFGLTQRKTVIVTYQVKPDAKLRSAPIQ